MNLMDMIKDQVSGSLVSHASKFLGESEAGVGKALDGIFPALMSKMIDTSEDSNGLGKLMDMAKGTDDSMLDDIGGLFGGGAGNIAKLMNGGSGVLNLLLGNSTGGMIDKIAGFSGLKGSAASSLIKMAAPFLMSMVGRHIKNKALDAVGLGKWLGGQRSSVQSSMPSGLLSALGAGFLGKGASAISGLASDGLDAGKKVVGGAADAAGKVVGGAADAGKKVVGGAADAAGKVVGGAADLAGDVGGAAVKTGGSMLKWLLPLALILIGGSYFGFKTGCSAVDNTVEATKDVGAAVVDKTGDVASGAVEGVADAAGAVGDVAKGAVDAIGGAFGKIDEVAKAALDKVSFTAGSAGSQMMDFISGGFKGDGRVTFKNITFATGKAEITAATVGEVDNMAAILKAYPGVSVTVEGYTDNTGNAANNKTLSQARANAVKARLIAKGIDESRIKAMGFGDANPVGDNSTKEGQAQNRRIEMIINK